MEPGLHGDLSCIAVNPGDAAIQRHSDVPGCALHLHSQHPDASRGLPVQVRVSEATWGGGSVTSMLARDSGSA